MSTYEDVSVVGRAKFLETRPPTASEVGAKVKDRFVDTTTGVIYSCVADTFGSQQWLGVDGSIIPVAILATDHPDLVAMYTMDNINGGTLEDETTNNNVGTIFDVTVVEGQIGSALSFDGVNDKVSLTYSPTFALDVGAVSAWVSTPIASATTYALTTSRSTNSNGYTALGITSGYTGDYRAYFSSANGAGTDSNRNHYSDTVLSPDTYYHVVWQSDGGTLQIYVDGVLQSLTEYSSLSNDGRFLGESPFMGNPKNRATIGVLDRPGPVYSAGSIDQLRVFRRTLTQEEITTLYNEGNQ